MSMLDEITEDYLKTKGAGVFIGRVPKAPYVTLVWREHSRMYEVDHQAEPWPLTPVTDYDSLSVAKIDFQRRLLVAFPAYVTCKALGLNLADTTLALNTVAALVTSHE